MIQSKNNLWIISLTEYYVNKEHIEGLAKLRGQNKEP